jgi:hypothetical protein
VSFPFLRDISSLPTQKPTSWVERKEIKVVSAAWWSIVREAAACQCYLEQVSRRTNISPASHIYIIHACSFVCERHERELWLRVRQSVQHSCRAGCIRVFICSYDACRWLTNPIARIIVIKHRSRSRAFDSHNCFFTYNFPTPLHPYIAQAALYNIEALIQATNAFYIVCIILPYTLFANN